MYKDVPGLQDCLCSACIYPLNLLISALLLSHFRTISTHSSFLQRSVTQELASSMSWLIDHLVGDSSPFPATALKWYFSITLISLLYPVYFLHGFHISWDFYCIFIDLLLILFDSGLKSQIAGETTSLDCKDILSIDPGIGVCVCLIQCPTCLGEHQLHLQRQEDELAQPPCLALAVLLTPYLMCSKMMTEVQGQQKLATVFRPALLQL